MLAASVTWRDILEPHGWTFAGTRGEVAYWRKPGKRSAGISATTNALGTDRLHVFSTGAAPFEPDTSYTKFCAFSVLEHGGDFAAAARALRREAVSA
jgi:putative DNA primase/helicase